MINISLQPEYILSVFGFLITNTFLTALLVTLFLSIWAISFFIIYHKRNKHHPTLSVWHIIVYELLKLADGITQDRTLSKKILPLIATLFLFIISTNLIALVPGFLGSIFIEIPEGNVSLLRSANSDLTTTLALALITVGAIQYFSMQYLGVGSYTKRFLNFSSILAFILGIFEMLSEALRVLSFSFRLFGNVFAGEVLLLVIAFLMPFVLPVPFMVLEVFVSIIQAYIFCILALTYIRLSTNTTLKQKI